MAGTVISVISQAKMPKLNRCAHAHRLCRLCLGVRLKHKIPGTCDHRTDGGRYGAGYLKTLRRTLDARGLHATKLVGAALGSVIWSESVFARGGRWW